MDHWSQNEYNYFFNSQQTIESYDDEESEDSDLEEVKSDAEEEIDVVPAVRRSTRPIKKKKLI